MPPSDMRMRPAKMVVAIMMMHARRRLDLREDAAARWTEARPIGLHAGGDAADVGNFRRTETKGVWRASLTLRFGRLEGLRTCEATNQKATLNQAKATCLAGHKTDVTHAHEAPLKRRFVCSIASMARLIRMAESKLNPQA